MKQSQNNPQQEKNQSSIRNENAIDMSPVCEHLRALKKVLPSSEPSLQQAAALLADRLNGTKVPAGFHTAAVTLFLMDLPRAKNGFTGERIESPLVGQNSAFYAGLIRRIPELADASCPKQFAEGVRAHHRIFAERVSPQYAESNIQSN